MLAEWEGNVGKEGIGREGTKPKIIIMVPNLGLGGCRSSPTQQTTSQFPRKSDFLCRVVGVCILIQSSLLVVALMELMETSLKNTGPAHGAVTGTFLEPHPKAPGVIGASEPPQLVHLGVTLACCSPSASPTKAMAILPRRVAESWPQALCREVKSPVNSGLCRQWALRELSGVNTVAGEKGALHGREETSGFSPELGSPSPPWLVSDNGGIESNHLLGFYKWIFLCSF